MYTRGEALSEQDLQTVEIEVGEQRLAMSRAMQWREFARLPGDRDDLTRRRVMVDEERLAAFEHHEVRRLFERRRQVSKELMKEHREEFPSVPPRQSPGRRPKDVIVAAFRIREKPALTKRVRQSEHTAAIDADQLGELFQRHWFG